MTDYPYIKRWGRHMGSADYYIEAQVEEAQHDQAPANAVHKDHDSGRWVTTDELYRDELRKALGLEPLEITPANIDGVAEWAGKGRRQPEHLDGAMPGALVFAFDSIWDARPFINFAYNRVNGLDLCKPLQTLTDQAYIRVVLRTPSKDGGSR